MKKKSSTIRLSKPYKNSILAFLSLVVFLLAINSQGSLAQPKKRSGLENPPGIPKVIDSNSPDSDTDDSSTTDSNLNNTDTAAAVSENQTEINVKNADIAAVIRIFSKKTKRNYILDERVKGKVSIYLPGKVSAEESLKILDSVLGLKGFTAVPLGENLWKIVPSKEAKQSTIPTLKEGALKSSNSNNVVTRILNLKYIAAEEAREVVAQLVSPDGLVSSYGGTNALLIIDYEDNVLRLVDIINTVDVPFSNREMTIIPIKNAEAPDIEKKLVDLLGLGEKKEGAASSPASHSPDVVKARTNLGAPQGGLIQNQIDGGVQVAQQDASGSAVKSRTLEPKVIADERTNSIVVVADDETTARIRALISQLDSEIDLSSHRFYVYRCQHAKAAELAQTLAGLMGGGGSNGSQTTGSNLADIGGSDGTNTNSKNRGGQFSSTQDRMSGQRRTPGRSRSENNTQKQSQVSVQLGDNLSITADIPTNSLIISSGKSDYEKIKSLLTQLDIKRPQVLVEAMLLEVRVGDTGDYGFDWLSSAGGADGGVYAKSDFGPSQNSLTTLFSNPSAISQFSVAAASKGSIKLPGGITLPSQSALLTAAQTNNNVNVLSAPNILTTDNEQAEIVVGENVPFLASKSTTTQNSDNIFNQIDRQDVGITLRLTPQISSQSVVNLKIFTEVSAIQSTTDLGPITSVRTSETSIIAKDGQMVVIGGLLADSKNTSEGGVPFLKDIPLLGWAFKSANDQISKTNLLIFITPRIIQDQFDMRDLTKEHRDVLENDIKKRDIEPNRLEQLHSDNIDKVTEIKEYDGDKPTTILPPLNGTETPSSNLKPKGTIKHDYSDDSPGVIQLKVQPKIPAVTSKLSSADRFILLKASSEEKPKAGFVWSQETKAFGIEIPEGSSQEALNFFKRGGRYRYTANNDTLNVSVISSYNSRTEAQSSLPGSSLAWYSLSPKEVMELGTGAWKKQ